MNRTTQKLYRKLTRLQNANVTSAQKSSAKLRNSSDMPSRQKSKLEQSDADAHRLVAKSRAEAVKRAKERTRDANRAVHQSAATLLRSRAAQSANVPDVPHVPLQDDWDAYEDKYSLLSSYYDPVSEAVRKDREGIRGPVVIAWRMLGSEL